MTLLAPLSLALSALSIPIVLMYVLKLRRQRHVVSSTFLWRRALDDVQANAPWQRLRFNILLVLQLLALAALVLSLAGPAYSRSHVVAGDLVLLIDQSYSMQARDVHPSRFTVAIERAHGLASSVASGNVVSVIGMGAQPHLVVAESGDRGAVAHAIDALRPGIQPPNFLGALSLAASLARAGQSTRVVVLTSRDSGIARLPLQVNFPVDIVHIGAQLHDLGITAFNATQRPSAVEAVARISNFGSSPARSDLDLHVDGRLADVRPLSIAAHHQQNLFWTDLPVGSRRLQIHLTQADDVPTDKSAWAAVPISPTRRILLVSSGDYFLQTALLLDPSIKLSEVPPSGYTAGMGNAYDLLVFDGVLPRSLPPNATLLIAPPRGQLGALRFAGTAAAGGMTPISSPVSNPQTSILRYVDLSDVHLAQTRTSSLPGWLQPLASSNGHTVLAAGDRGSSRLAVVTFDLQHSDWPLRISFPIVLQDLVHYLVPGLTLGETSVTTGQSVTLVPPPGTGELTVKRPDGLIDRLHAPFPPFTDTSRPGFYSVVGTSGQAGPERASASFAVNFFPARSAPVAGPAVSHAGRSQTGKTLMASLPISVAWIFGLLAVAILGLEWWVAFRGIHSP